MTITEKGTLVSLAQGLTPIEKVLRCLSRVSPLHSPVPLAEIAVLFSLLVYTDLLASQYEPGRDQAANRSSVQFCKVGLSLHSLVKMHRETVLPDSAQSV